MVNTYIEIIFSCVMYNTVCIYSLSIYLYIIIVTCYLFKGGLNGGN